jgi:hypothetical protein
MAEQRDLPEQPVATEEARGDHPVEPAEGAREPGEDSNTGRTPRPDEPAEGER